MIYYEELPTLLDLCLYAQDLRLLLSIIKSLYGDLKLDSEMNEPCVVF